MVRVIVDLNKAKAKVSRQSHQRGHYAVANQALASMDPYVPARDWILRNTATVAIDGTAVNYNTPYARPQFYGMIKGSRISNYTTPGTGRRWDLRMKSKHMDKLTEAYLKGAGY